MWWLLGGLVVAVVAIVLYQNWPARRPSPLAARYIMAETADGAPLQFLVRATRGVTPALNIATMPSLL